uniref:Myosin motor domain-containing protein n=1 Tax=Heterorhabditis bacteriophora TaxID=37862 RepID=A0A1I7X5P9_HETBA
MSLVPYYIQGIVDEGTNLFDNILVIENLSENYRNAEELEAKQRLKV